MPLCDLHIMIVSHEYLHFLYLLYCLCINVLIPFFPQKSVSKFCDSNFQINWSIKCPLVHCEHFLLHGFVLKKQTWDISFSSPHFLHFCQNLALTLPTMQHYLWRFLLRLRCVMQSVWLAWKRRWRADYRRLVNKLLFNSKSPRFYYFLVFGPNQRCLKQLFHLRRYFKRPLNRLWCVKLVGFLLCAK